MSDMYFEDFEAGQTFVSPGRTISEADLSLFNMISGDWHPIHADEEYAKETQFGTRIVSGVFGISVMTGLSGKFGIFDKSVVAMLSLEDWLFHAPIFVGDTLHIKMIIADKRLTSQGDRGVLDRKFLLINQRGETIQEGRSKALILCRPKVSQSSAT